MTGAQIRPLAWPLAGTAAALVLSPALELILGHEVWYLVALLATFVGCWALTRYSRAEVGFRLGPLAPHGVALTVPIAVIGLSAAAAWLAGAVAIDPQQAARAPRLLALMFASTLIGVLITEDGFFRGWLWAALRRAGASPRATLLWTSAAFAAWHLPVAIIEPDFALPPAIIPVYLANAFLLGLAWGLLRQVSGSVLTAAFCHAVWNALAYVLFGYGKEAGALGVAAFRLFGPERGLLGLALNLAAALLLWRWAARRGDAAGGR